MVSKNYAEYILDLLSPFGSITSRAMFGGYGIYKDKIIIGLIIDDELYFKVNNSNQQQYEMLNSSPFTYSTIKFLTLRAISNILLAKAFKL